MVWDLSKVNTEIWNTELSLSFEYIKEENSKWMKGEIKMYSDIFLNEALEYTIRS